MTMTLHDRTSSPWCVKCGLSYKTSREDHHKGLCGQCGTHTCRPGIFTRLPESMPDGLRWDTVWMLRVYDGVHYGISNAQAEEQLVGHWTIKNRVLLEIMENGLWRACIALPDTDDLVYHDAATPCEAAVIALHRFCDAQEAKT